MKRRNRILLIAVAALVAAPIFQAPQVALADDFIDINVANVPPEFRRLFRNASSFWNDRITGYSGFVPRIFRETLVPEINITANLVGIDGFGGVLGQAGPTDVATYSQDNGPFSDERTWAISQAGDMQFDVADFRSGQFTNKELQGIVIHEMAHALGFGSLWQQNGLIGADGNYDFDGFGLRTYRAETGNPLQASIPVEMDGGPGSAGAHWDDGVFDTDGDGIIDSFPGNLFNQTYTDAFRADYMLAFLQQPSPNGGFVSPDLFLTATTLASFEDVGLGTILRDPDTGVVGIIKFGNDTPPIFFRNGSVPEPGSVVLLLGASLLALSRRKRS